MKYILSSYGVNNPYVVADIPDHAVYPIGIEGDDFIDLDYSLLLVGTGFLFDNSALEYLIGEQQRLPFLSPLIISIQRLHEEGLLETFDGKAIIDEHRSQILEKTEMLCEDVVGWLGPVRSQWKALKADREEFLRKFGSPEKRKINEHHFAVANAVLKIDGSLNPALLTEITRLVDSRRKQFSSKEAEYIKEVLRPLVGHTVMQDLIRFKMRGAILDWEDSQPYYERLYAARWEGDDERRLAYHAKSLFDISLPEFRPKKVDAVIKFISKERNVKALRADIVDILTRGHKFDESLGRRIVKEVFESELAIKRKMRKFRFLGAIASVIIPGSSLLTESAIEGAAAVGEDSTEKVFKRSHRWLYSLRD